MLMNSSKSLRELLKDMGREDLLDGLTTDH